MARDGRQVVGDPIPNASHIADTYCFHDIFQLAYAAVLGWSPVTRAPLNRKRRSNPQTDEAKGRGRAVVIEEGIAALGVPSTDPQDITAGPEVRADQAQ